MSQQNISRRQLLRAGVGASLLGTGVNPFGLGALSDAMAQTNPADGYKALVCVFLFGGNDGHDMLHATDPVTQGDYLSARGASALSPNSLLQLSLVAGSRHGTRPFAVHPALAPIVPLFNGIGGPGGRRHLAFVPNVGTLLTPTAKAQYLAGSVPLPPMLFSHNDQFNMWQAGQGEGASFGWGGQLGDRVLALNGGGSVFTCVSTAGTTVWLSGRDALQYQVMPGTARAVRIEGRDALFNSPDAGAAYTQILQRGDGLFGGEYRKVVQRSIDSEQAVNAAVDALAEEDAPRPPVEAGVLGLQLRAVCRMIKASSSGALGGIKRQVFFVSMGGFDTHSNQFASQQDPIGQHARLLSQLAKSLEYFHSALGSDLINRVTTFTASDFGRTLATNEDGTDHGWGSHHIVMGGDVFGGDIFGQWPNLGSSSPDLVELGRVLLPRISVDQYAATLGRWFGLNTQQLLQVFPNLKNFPQASHPHDLGFLRA